MRIIVFAKEVLDPDAVNNFALAGRLTIGDDGRTITQTAVPRVMNAYDEQAIEAALRIRDVGADCRITVVSAGEDPSDILRHAASLGADEIVSVSLDPSSDCWATARALAAYVRHSGGADLLLFGRQASDDDQGVVPALVTETLGLPLVTIARDVHIVNARETPAVRVTRVTPDGDETVECALPAAVTISNELGPPRYPTATRMMAARKMTTERLSPADLGLTPSDIEPVAQLERLYVPDVHGNCEFIDGDEPAEIAAKLLQRLREERVLA